MEDMLSKQGPTEMQLDVRNKRFVRYGAKNIYPGYLERKEINLNGEY